MEAERIKKENLQREIEIAKSNALEVEQRMEAKKQEEMSADKLALMNKFGYEVEDGEDEEEDTGVTSNRDHAVKQKAEQAQKLRSNNNQPTKSQLRAETMKAKADKNAKKEERRKRAAKGERRR